MKDNIMDFNALKRLKLIENILKSNGNYRLLCIDVDDVIFNTEPLMQEQLKEIDYRATSKYREKIAHRSSEDTRELNEKSYDILDAILEEMSYVDYDDEKEKTTIKNFKPVDYKKIYQRQNLLENAVLFVKSILDSREESDFVIFLSHRNPEREGIVKTKILYELFPEVDAIEILPFHLERGSKVVNSKALWLKQVYNLESLNNCYLIDNARKNCKDFKMHGGNFIRYLQDGFDEESTLSDYMSKLTNLDPYMLQFAVSFVNYCRNNPDYLKEVDISMDKVKSL
ncbi:MAG: hypothetical protein IKN63_03495 [Bacilli bacterium]|nr:hypothetical protein [Bacilli bacterium]